MTTVLLPSGTEVKHSSERRFHVFAETCTGAHRITSRDDLSPAVNAYYATTLRQPEASVWLIDGDTGVVLRPLRTNGGAA